MSGLFRERKKVQNMEQKRPGQCSVLCHLRKGEAFCLQLELFLLAVKASLVTVLQGLALIGGTFPL